MHIIGVDPGATGAIALLDWSDGHPGKLVDLYDMPTQPNNTKGTCLDEKKVLEIITVTWRHHIPRIAFIEQVNGHATKNLSSAFNFGGYFHSMRVLISTAGIPHEFLMPAAWKKTMECQGKGPEGKVVAVVKARTLWPESEKLFLKTKDGRADAALIAAAGRNLRDE